MNKDQKEYTEFWNEVLTKVIEVRKKYDKLSDKNKIRADKDARRMLWKVRGFKGLTDYIKSHFC